MRRPRPGARDQKPRALRPVVEVRAERYWRDLALHHQPLSPAGAPILESLIFWSRRDAVVHGRAVPIPSLSSSSFPVSRPTGQLSLGRHAVTVAVGQRGAGRELVDGWVLVWTGSSWSSLATSTWCGSSRRVLLEVDCDEVDDDLSCSTSRTGAARRAVLSGCCLLSRGLVLSDVLVLRSTSCWTTTCSALDLLVSSRSSWVLLEVLLGGLLGWSCWCGRRRRAGGRGCDALPMVSASRPFWRCDRCRHGRVEVYLTDVTRSAEASPPAPRRRGKPLRSKALAAAFPNGAARCCWRRFECRPRRRS